MKIMFKSDRMKRNCTVERWLVRTWGANRAAILRRRLGQLRAAENLEHMSLVHPRIHELKGDRKGLISLDLDGGYRLLIEPAESPPPQKADGGLDLRRIAAVRVVAVEDTHD